MVSCYDEDDSNTGKRKHNCETVHHSFKIIPDGKYTTRFRKYLAAHETTKLKLNEADSFTYYYFEKAQKQLLSIYDIPLKRFALKKTNEVGDETSVASDYWLYNFKWSHDMCNRKTTNFVVSSAYENK